MSSSEWIDHFISRGPVKHETLDTIHPEKKPAGSGGLIGYTRAEVEEAFRKKNERLGFPVNKK
ncbi:MAG: hypothetical protein PHH16_00135 [Candidatus Gracilibacteria bacterium]|nr:hypothetical protein [Candidatus Gracilibacteria bacterium]